MKIVTTNRYCPKLVGFHLEYGVSSSAAHLKKATEPVGGGGEPKSCQRSKWKETGTWRCEHFQGHGEKDFTS